MKCLKIQRTHSSEKIETEKEFKERIRSHNIIYFTHFEIVISFMSIAPSFWPYLNKVDPTAGKHILGLQFTVSALGQMLVSVILGRLSNKFNSSRIILKYLLIIKVISHLMYASLEIVPTVTHRRYWFLISRLIAGFSNGAASLTRTYVATSTTISERRKAISILSSYSTLAEFLGPLLQYVLIGLGEDGFWLCNIIKIDMYTAPNWFLIFVTLINLILMHPRIFVEYDMLKKSGNATKKENYSSNKNYKYIAWSFVVLNFLFMVGFMFMNLLATPIAMDEFAMSRKDAVNLNSAIKTCCAVLSFITILVLNPLCKTFGEMQMFVISAILMFLGNCFFYPLTTEPHVTYDNRNATCIDCIGCPLKQEWCNDNSKINMYQFIIAHIIETIAISWVNVLVYTIFSKVLGSKQQGTWMGIITSSGSLSRIITPVVLIEGYTIYGPKLTIVAMNTFYAVIVGILFGYILYATKRNNDEEVDIHFLKEPYQGIDLKENDEGTNKIEDCIVEENNSDEDFTKKILLPK